MTTNPFQSTAATGPQPHELMEAIAGAQPQTSVDSLVGSRLCAPCARLSHDASSSKLE